MPYQPDRIRPDADRTARSIRRPGPAAPASETGQNRTGSRTRQLAPYNSTAAGSPATTTAPLTTSTGTGTSRAKSPPSKPKRPAKAGNDYSRLRLPGSRQKLTAPPAPTDGAPDLIAHAVEMGTELLDLHRRTGMSRLRVDPNRSLAQRIRDAERRSRVIGQWLARYDASETSLRREVDLVLASAKTVQDVLPDILKRLAAVPVDDLPLRVALQRLHTELHCALVPVVRTLDRAKTREHVALHRDRQRLADDSAAVALAVAAAAQAAKDPSTLIPKQRGGYPTPPQPDPTKLHMPVPADGHLRPVDKMFARRAPDLLRQPMPDAEVEARFALHTWRDHGAVTLTRTRLDPPSNLHSIAKLIAHVDPTQPEALDVVATVLHAAHDHDDERNLPGFKFGLEGLMLAYAWDRPEFAHIKIVRDRVAALTRCWRAELARPADPKAAQHLAAWRQARTAAATNAYSLDKIAEASARLARMRAWFGKYTPRNAPALRQLLTQAGMIAVTAQGSEYN